MFTKNIFFSLVVGTIASGSLAGVTRAASFNFSYRESGGTITAILEGTLQGDNDTVLVTSVGSPRFNGSPASPVPFVGTYTSFASGSILSPGILSLSGSTVDFIACTINDPVLPCTDGFVFVPANFFGPSPIFASQGSYGGDRVANFLAANYSLTPVSSTAVPEPGLATAVVVTGLGFLRGKRKRSTRALESGRSLAIGGGTGFPELLETRGRHGEIENVPRARENVQ
jgi:hypothetical protein